MRITICGTRGSSPAPGRDFVKYGGHTSCIAVMPPGAVAPELILDAGTGIRNVTPLLAGRPFAGAIALTHPHRDHVHGLPFSGGSDSGGAPVRLLMPAPADGTSAEALLARGMSPPHFPITPRQLRGQWEFNGIEPGIVHDSFWYAADFDPAETLGHAAAEYAIGLAVAAGARQVLLLHHRPDRTDSELEKLAAGLRDSPVPVALAADGEVMCR